MSGRRRKARAIAAALPGGDPAKQPDAARRETVNSAQALWTRARWEEVTDKGVAFMAHIETNLPTLREALQEPLSSILESVRITLERCPPELSADLVDRARN